MHGLGLLMNEFPLGTDRVLSRYIVRFVGAAHDSAHRMISLSTYPEALLKTYKCGILSYWEWMENHGNYAGWLGAVEELQLEQKRPIWIPSRNYQLKVPCPYKSTITKPFQLFSACKLQTKTYRNIVNILSGVCRFKTDFRNYLGCPPYISHIHFLREMLHAWPALLSSTESKAFGNRTLFEGA